MAIEYIIYPFKDYLMNVGDNNAIILEYYMVTPQYTMEFSNVLHAYAGNDVEESLRFTSNPTFGCFMMFHKKVRI